MYENSIPTLEHACNVAVLCSKSVHKDVTGQQIIR